MVLKPIKKKRLFEEIIVAVEKYIQEENIRPGEKLPSENELATIFNVSKTAVREAMSVLHANRIIESRAGAGIFLKDLHGENILQRVASNLMEKNELTEVLEFRRGIEVAAVALASMKAKEEDIKKIKEAQRQLVEANKANEIGVKEDYLFHYYIILASHNSIYKNVFEAVSPKLKEGIRISKLQSMKVPGRFRAGHKEHEKIIEAIEQKNPELAAHAMTVHLVNNEGKIWANFKRDN